ncbi:MAG: hypothetical protein ITG00_00145 [Flavobacterium sp.]|nr:hypothetical protein [Flavobacterium sp.]
MRVQIAIGGDGAIVDGATPRKNIEVNITRDGQNGASAYQIWLDGGHEGTPEDFLAWLQANSGVSQEDLDQAVSEMEAYTDGVAADLQLNIEDVEDEVNALAAEVDLKLDKTEPSTLFTGNVMQFDKPRSYGNWFSPLSAFGYFSTSDAVLHTESVIYYNASALPSGILNTGSTRIGGDFVPNVVNKITARYVSTSNPRFEYTIEQRNPETPITLTYASTFVLDMAIRAPQLMTLGGNITFNTPTNITPGAEISLVITGGAATHTVAFPAFKWMNGSPPSLPAGKELIVWLFSKGTTVGDVIASYTIQS